MRFVLDLEHATWQEAEAAAWRASVLAGVSRVLAENRIDHRPEVESVARMAAIATGAACVIDLFPEVGGMGLGLRISREITTKFSVDRGSHFSLRNCGKAGDSTGTTPPSKELVGMGSLADGMAARPVRFTAELSCLLCGRSLGTLDGGSTWPPRGQALLHRPGCDQPMPIVGWWRLRCATCGGALMATDVTSHPVRPEAAVDWTPVGVPHGRPPNWLRAERAAATERRES